MTGGFNILTWLRTLFQLARVSTLPTVWSNCLAAWFLSGGGPLEYLVAVCAGVSCFHVGGMCLNHACDASVDAQRRRQRPIPSGAIAVQTVLLMAVGWFMVGAIIMAAFGVSLAILSILLMASIILYYLTHNLLALAPVLLATTRFFIYLIAGAAAPGGISGLAVWSAIAVAMYMAGVGCFGRAGVVHVQREPFPVILMCAPIVLAGFANGAGYRWAALSLSVALIAWISWCLYFFFTRPQPSIRLARAGLVAGIILVDWLALGAGEMASILFPILFVMAVLLQRVDPAL